MCDSKCVSTQEIHSCRLCVLFLHILQCWAAAVDICNLFKHTSSHFGLWLRAKATFVRAECLPLAAKPLTATYVCRVFTLNTTQLLMLFIARFIETWPRDNPYFTYPCRLLFICIIFFFWTRRVINNLISSLFVWNTWVHLTWAPVIIRHRCSAVCVCVYI